MPASNKIPRALRLFVTFGGAGNGRKGSGTRGTVAAIPLCCLTLWAGPLWHMGFVLALTLVAMLACERYERLIGGHDHQEIVIDEVVGFLITVTWLPFTWQTMLAGFILFRFFDIAKPWPISWMDQRIGGGVGVVADDIAAGLAANILLQIVFTHTSWLGSQLI